MKQDLSKFYIPKNFPREYQLVNFEKVGLSFSVKFMEFTQFIWNKYIYFQEKMDKVFLVLNRFCRAFFYYMIKLCCVSI